jgi:hypothetical protein
MNDQVKFWETRNIMQSRNMQISGKYRSGIGLVSSKYTHTEYIRYSVEITLLTEKWIVFQLFISQLSLRKKPPDKNPMIERLTLNNSSNTASELEV